MSQECAALLWENNLCEYNDKECRVELLVNGLNSSYGKCVAEKRRCSVDK